jgi:hypothetical protein
MSQPPFDPYGKTIPLRPYASPSHASGLPWWVIPVLVLFLLLCTLGLLCGYLLASVVSSAGNTLFTHVATKPGSQVTIPAFGGKQPPSASAVAEDFMQGLKSQDYLRAYNDFDAAVLVLETPEDFDQQVRRADTCYGTITHYQVIAHTEGQGEAHIIYRITRKKFSGAYAFQLVLLHNDTGNWTITNYGKNDQLLPPGIPACA